MTFCELKTFNSFPADLAAVVSFIANLFSEQLAPSTITSIVSAISYVHKACNQPDPTSTFVVRKMLQGASKLSSVPDTRLPITKDVLMKFYNSCEYTCSSFYDKVLFRTMFVTAFHGFLRIGEIAGVGSHVILAQHIQLVNDSYSITFHSFKHHSGTPLTMHVKPSTSPCPVSCIKEYLALRPKLPGPLFLTSLAKAVSRDLFTQQLTASLTWAGLDTRLYKAHSFRIGAATHAASLGYADAEIQAMGRWKSGAFKKYVRLPTVSL